MPSWLSPFSLYYEVLLLSLSLPVRLPHILCLGLNGSLSGFGSCLFFFLFFWTETSSKLALHLVLSPSITPLKALQLLSLSLCLSRYLSLSVCLSLTWTPLSQRVTMKWKKAKGVKQAPGSGGGTNGMARSLLFIAGRSSNAESERKQ